MIRDILETYAKSRALSTRDALQTFLQCIILKNLRHPTARLMSGTALVLGHGNPRFSEDIDFTAVEDPLSLESSLLPGVRESEEWLREKIRLSPPKTGNRTWVLTARLEDQPALRLHVDSQPYRAYGPCPVVINFPGLNPIICPSVTTQEIMADKLIAVAFRSYLGGRDLFDLWFHWLRQDACSLDAQPIHTMTRAKLKDRGLPYADWEKRLTARLSAMHLARARQEWTRYIPGDFMQADIVKDILQRMGALPKVLGL